MQTSTGTREHHSQEEAEYLLRFAIAANQASGIASGKSTPGKYIRIEKLVSELTKKFPDARERGAALGRMAPVFSGDGLTTLADLVLSDIGHLDGFWNTVSSQIRDDRDFELVNNLIRQFVISPRVDKRISLEERDNLLSRLMHTFDELGDPSVSKIKKLLREAASTNRLKIRLAGIVDKIEQFPTVPKPQRREAARSICDAISSFISSIDADGRSQKTLKADTAELLTPIFEKTILASPKACAPLWRAFCQLTDTVTSAFGPTAFNSSQKANLELFGQVFDGPVYMETLPAIDGLPESAVAQTF